MEQNEPKYFDLITDMTIGIGEIADKQIDEFRNKIPESRRDKFDGWSMELKMQIVWLASLSLSKFKETESVVGTQHIVAGHEFDRLVINLQNIMGKKIEEILT